MDFNYILSYFVKHYAICRNGLAPKKLHLEIALGTTSYREGDLFFFFVKRKKIVLRIKDLD